MKTWGILKYNSSPVSRGKINWDSVFIARYKQIETLPVDSFYTILKADIKKYSTGEPFNHSTQSYVNLKFYGLDSLSGKRLIALLFDSKVKGNYYTDAGCKEVSPCFKNETRYADDSMKFPAYRSLMTARVWNIINFLYPFKEMIQTDWNSFLRESLTKEQSVKSVKEFEWLLLELMAKLGDAHALLFGGDAGFMGDKFFPPLTVGYIDSSFMVTALFDDLLSKVVHVGDRIEGINHMAVDSVVNLYSKYISSVYPVYRNETMVYNYFLPGDSNSEISFGLRNSNGSMQTVQIKRSCSFDSFNLRRNGGPEKGVTEKDIYYANFSAPINKKTFQQNLKSSRTLILDLRQYPDWQNRLLLKFLCYKEIGSVNSKEVDFKHPGTFTIRKQKLAKFRSSFKGNVIVLIGSNTVSMGEYFCLLLKAGNPGILFLGDTTAGAIGEFTIIPLYGNAGVSYTGNGILINNETFQQRGIPPDIRVVKNRNDIINNKDAELIKAIELAKGRK